MAKFTIEKVRLGCHPPVWSPELELSGPGNPNNTAVLTSHGQDIAQHIKRTVRPPPGCVCSCALQLTQDRHSLTRGRDPPGIASWAATLAASSPTVRSDEPSTYIHVKPLYH